MPTVGWRDHLRAAAIVLAISALGFGVRFLMVHVPPGFDTYGTCHNVDFRNGDQFFCDLSY